MSLTLSSELPLRTFDRKKYQLRFAVVPNEFELRKLIICVVSENKVGTLEDDEYAYEIHSGGDPFIWVSSSRSDEYLEEKMTGTDWTDPREIYFMKKLVMIERFKKDAKGDMKKAATVNREALMQAVELFFEVIEKELGLSSPDSERFAFVTEKSEDSKKKGLLSGIIERMGQVGKAIKRQI